VRFLVDAQLPPRLAQWLVKQGAEKAIHVRDIEGGLVLPDKNVWETARENGWIIVTKDIDFFELSAVFGLPPKVVLIRYGNCANKIMIERLLRVWSESTTQLVKEDVRLILLTKEAMKIYHRQE